MIDLVNKQDCVGCDACAQRCPVSCISMQPDLEGFRYPHVDTEKCINCGLCEQVCPVIHQADARKPLNVFAAKNIDDEIRKASSSGGIFTALAQQVIAEGGVVFGAKFDDNWEVVHSSTGTTEGLKAFQGSKYVQSKIGRSYLEAEQFLKAGRKVLFSGTPCQLAGLSRFLRKDYGDLLLTVDVACHGVPSSRVWKAYLSYQLSLIGKGNRSESPAYRSISKINFRDIRHGWYDYGFSITGKRNIGTVDVPHELFFERRVHNLFMRGFLSNLYLRPSCYTCPAKCGKSHSDLTIADYWGIDKIHPSFYDRNGVSLVLANTENGIKALNRCKPVMIESDYNQAASINTALTSSPPRPAQADLFWKAFTDEGIKCLAPILSRMEPNVFQKILWKLRDLLS